MAATTYKGTAISGHTDKKQFTVSITVLGRSTSVAATVLNAKPAVNNIKAGDYYQNTQLGHLYLCNSRSGLNCNFTYVRTDTIGKPAYNVTGLATPTKNNAELLTAKWTKPGSSTISGFNAQSINAYWTYNKSSGSHTATHRGLALTTTSDTLTIGYANYYPRTSVKLNSITLKVATVNQFGDVSNPPSATYTFSVPRQPVISPLVFDTSNGHVTSTVTTNAGTDAAHRYDTRVKVTRVNADGSTTVITDTATTATSYPIDVDLPNYQGMEYGQYMRVIVEAWARGVKGDSAHQMVQYTIAYPGTPTIVDTTISGGQNGKATFSVRTGHMGDKSPVQQVKLQYLPDVTYSNASQIPATAEWVDSGIVDDGGCTAMSMSTQDLVPSAGNRTWVRLKNWYANELVLYRYSAPVRLYALETPAPSASDDAIKVLNVASDVGRLKVLLGWNADGMDDSTGTELSWSADPDGWRSTTAPSTFQFDWSDGLVKSGGVTYRDSATVYVDGLEAGTVYYIRARRYMENGDGIDYGNYCNAVRQQTYEEAPSIEASSTSWVPKGDAITVDWSTSFEQTAAQVVMTDGTVLQTVYGARQTCTIPDTRYNDFLNADGTINYRVTAFSRGASATTEYVLTSSVVQRPTLAVSTASELTAQPMSVSLECSRPLPVTLVVASQGVDGETAAGSLRQMPSDTIWSGVVMPEWALDTSSGLFRAVYDLPDGLALIQNASYTVSATAIDEQRGGMESNLATAETTVAWARLAVEPEVELTPVDEVDEDGQHIQAVTIALTTAEGQEPEDVCDVYRISGETITLIGTVATDATVTDYYAPFGAAMAFHYRVATRTPDGSEAWTDVEYALDGRSLRFDWPEGTLELPYNISVQDAYAKNVEYRTHIDGETDAYWNKGASRKAAYSSDMVRLMSQEDVVLARKLARWPGSVFVRTPDGSAFEADVQVGNLATEGVIEAISINAVEVAPTGAFALEV